jgi:hypothetical protein
MKFSGLLTVALLIGILSSNVQAQNAGPFLWTSYVESVANYLRSNSQGTFVSRFTPGVAITVTRVQLQASQGSVIYPNTRCSRVPRISVTDGTTDYLIAIPRVGQNGSHPPTVHSDSGPIAVSFPQDANLRLRVVPGESGCGAFGINVTVQYKVN